MPLPEGVDSLSHLDVLYASIGLGPEWRRSDARAELAEELTVPGEVVSGHQEAPHSGQVQGLSEIAITSGSGATSSS